MSLWRSIDGVVEVEITAAEPENALTEIIRSGIEIRSVCRDKDLVCAFSVRRRDDCKLAALCKKRGWSHRVIRQYGIYYDLARLIHRKMLFFGMGILLFTALFLPTRVLFIRVEGNDRIPTNKIISAAEESGIHFGTSRRYVRSEKVKNTLLDIIPQLQWAGVNTNGCTAVISVRERYDTPVSQGKGSVSSIVADRDGYILSCVVTQGTAKIQPGQSVLKGQILISGYTECGICIQATQARGEVIAQTSRELTVAAPAKCKKRSGISKNTHRISLLLGKKRIFFWKGSGISDAGCGRMYRQYDLTLPGGFRLPIALCVDTYQSYDLVAGESEVSSLEAFARNYLTSKMVSGQILSSTEKIQRSGDKLLYKGRYVCTESIGKVRQEQIGESNGKTNGENR